MQNMPKVESFSCMAFPGGLKADLFYSIALE